MQATRSMVNLYDNRPLKQESRLTRDYSTNVIRKGSNFKKSLFTAEKMPKITAGRINSAERAEL